MQKYGQFCPVARSLEILGDRWTLLIIRDMILGTRHFNDLERGLPGISRALLSSRLRQLEKSGIIEKRFNQNGRNTTEYRLTDAGKALEGVIFALRFWGMTWAFGEPVQEELNSALLMWWLHQRVMNDRLPDERIVVQFDFYGSEAVRYWLVLTKEDTSLCLTDPGFEVNVLVTADLATFFKLCMGRITYHDAQTYYDVNVEGIPHWVRAFPVWFGWKEPVAV